MSMEASTKPKRKTLPVYVSAEWEDALSRIAAEMLLKQSIRISTRQLVEQALAKVYGPAKPQKQK